MYSDMTLLALLTGIIVPLLVGLVTKINASAAIKAILNFGLTALGTALATANQIDWNWKAFAINFGVGWAVSVASYYGFYKPTGVADKVADVVPDFGIG
jgi:hypothetical protein